jgi:hypothetical protein
VKWRAVEEMLNRCAPGWELRVTDHYRSIRWRGNTFPSFPGPKKGEVQVGHVRHLVRHLLIDRGCACGCIELLGK